MAGVWTSVCIMFPALDAMAAGFKVYAVIDASGDPSELESRTTLARFTQAGVIPTTANAVICEIHRTWNRPEAAELAQLYTMVAPNYRAVMESYQTALEVSNNPSWRVRQVGTKWAFAKSSTSSGEKSRVQHALQKFTSFNFCNGEVRRIYHSTDRTEGDVDILVLIPTPERRNFRNGNSEGTIPCRTSKCSALKIMQSHSSTFSLRCIRACNGTIVM
jgi:hypothetical protein